MANLFVNGVFAAVGLDVYVDGDVTFNDGDINLEGSTWEIGGDLTATSAVDFIPNCFDAAIFDVGGDFNFTGTSSHFLDLNASSEWFLNVVGTGTAAYVSVGSSDAAGGSTIIANNSIDNGTINWKITNVVKVPREIACPVASPGFCCSSNRGFALNSFQRYYGDTIKGAYLPAITKCVQQAAPITTIQLAP